MTLINISYHALKLNLKSKSLRQTKQSLLMLIIIILTPLLSACQLTSTTVNDRAVSDIAVKATSYSQYYLWLKTLNNKQILSEEKKLKSLTSDSSQQAISTNQSKLILIYSLSATSLHQPYKAKRMLNEYLLTSDGKSKENVAFTLLLRDQLNTQLHLLEKQNATDKECNKQLDEHHLIIEQLQNQLNQVNKQLILLKKIEQNINERG